MTAPWPIEIRLRRAANVLGVAFDDGAEATLAARLLRAMTPSAADRGHGIQSFEPIPNTSPHVRLTDVQAVGSYALRLLFDDGHDSGLYTWERLHRIAVEAPGLERELTRAAP